MASPDFSLTEWVFGGIATATTFFLRHLHGKIDRAASKDDLAKAIADVKSEHTLDRQELRETQISIFNKLETQSTILADLNAKVGLLVSGHLK